MSQSKQLKQVFLIYAHTDKPAIRKLYHRLTRNHIDVWLDEMKLLPGQNWKHEIRQSILSSQAVIICLSKQFNKQGGFRHEELKIALRKARTIPEDQIFLIPVRLEPCDLPELLGNWHCVDLFAVNAYKKLLKSFGSK